MAPDTRDRILLATSELMRRQGYAGTSLKEISAEAKAPFSSIYFYFPGGKEQVAAEAVAAAAARFKGYLASSLPKANSVADLVRAYFTPGIKALDSSDFQAGCPVGTPANDAPVGATGLKTACDEALESFASIVALELRRLGRTPKVAKAEATLIVASNQGAILLARTAQDRAPIQAALDALMRLT
jgi:TetR/AcrR family transcriptional repressor of lmrAB and yxaGH operons